MSERDHGRRYSFAEKKDILDYLERNTYKDTSKKYKISETTLSRWKKATKSGSKKNSSKIIISLPKFWLEYLNEEIESDVWENYSEAFLSILRDHFKNQKSMQNADLKYLEEVKEIIPNLIDLNPDIDSMLLASSKDVIYKTKRWGSTEGIQNIIENWKKFGWRKIGKVRIEFQNETYNIFEASPKHIIGVKKFRKPLNNRRPGYLLGLKRKLVKDDVFIFAIAKSSEESSLVLAMNTLKRAAMGSLPPISEISLDDSLKTSKDMPSSELKVILQRRKDYIEKAQEIISEDPQIVIKEQTTGLNSLNSRIREKFGDDIVENKGFKKSYLKESQVNWLIEKNRIFQIKTNPFLMRVAKLVNSPLRSEENEVLVLLEKKLGKKIDRIIADPEQETDRVKLGKIPWLRQENDFPVREFPCHYIASNGVIILLTLFNLGLPEIPSEIAHLKNLTYLNLSFNNLTELPKTFSKLNSLELLFLDNNQFNKVPDSLIELSKLRILDLRDNKITKIPSTLTDGWQQRFKDQFDLGYFSSNCTAKLNFTGNQVEYSSLSRDQIELERGFLLDISIPRPFKALNMK